MSGKRNRATRRTARLGLAGVSAIAGVVSYFHALTVVQATGATAPVSYLVPFLADLVILAASAALLEASRTGQGRPGLAMVALLAGVGVTLAMNVMAYWPHKMPPWLVYAWPAVAFILALESLASILRRDSSPATDDHGEPLSTKVALAALVASDTERNLEEVLRIPRSRVQAWKRQLATAAEELPAGDSTILLTPAVSNGNGAHG